MTKSYTDDSMAAKFKNRPEKEIIHDPDYQKYREEQTNIMKMSTILKSLNAPHKKKNRGVDNLGSKFGGTAPQTTNNHTVSSNSMSIRAGLSASGKA